MHNLSAAELLAQLSSGSLTSTVLVENCLKRIAQCDGAVGAFLNCHGDSALDQAAKVDARRQRGEPVGALAGLPIALKDVLCTQGEATTCASRMLENYRPPYDATVVSKLRAADAVLIGKTNLDEFAMGGSTENSALGQTANPWDLACVPGGSSGGSAAAVAAGMVPLSLGTDTGGSIRQPASFCGIVGMKPTYGRVSRFGLVAFASSLDQIGPFARSVDDAALLLETIAGHDPRDSTSLNAPVPKYTTLLNEPLQGLKLGVVREHYGPGLDGEVEAAVREAVQVYQSLGAEVREVSLPHSKYAVAVYYIIAPSEASSNLARYDGVHYGYRTPEKEMLAKKLRPGETPLVRMFSQSREEGFGAEVKRRIMLGTYTLSAGYYDAYYVKALKVRRLIRQDYDAALKEVDLIVGPVSPTPAFRRGEKGDDPLAMYLTDLYTVSANLAGLPGISFPCGLSQSGLPIGLQLQGPALAEAQLLQAAAMYQRATDWHTRRPPLEKNIADAAAPGVIA